MYDRGDLQKLAGTGGLIPLVTGTMSWCPLYNLLGLSSLKISESET